MGNHWLPSITGLMLLSTVSIASDRFSLDGTMFEAVGEATSIDPLLLYSIAITESAAGVGKGGIQPQPYVFRTDSGPRFFDSLEEAQKALADVLKTTKNVDVGMMQVNLLHHPQSEPLKLLEPVRNLTVASQILKTSMSSTSDRVIGVGRYHSWRDDFAQWYGSRVWQTYQNLESLVAYQE